MTPATEGLRVKIGDKWYTDNDTPILIEFSVLSKSHVKNMASENFRYASAPDSYFLHENDYVNWMNAQYKEPVVDTGMLTLAQLNAAYRKLRARCSSLNAQLIKARGDTYQGGPSASIPACLSIKEVIDSIRQVAEKIEEVETSLERIAVEKLTDEENQYVRSVLAYNDISIPEL